MASFASLKLDSTLERTMTFASTLERQLDVTVRLNCCKKDHIATNLPLTGWAVWFGALNLCDYAMAHVDLFRGKSILEVGSGVGLVGISIAAMLAAERREIAACNASHDGSDPLMPTQATTASTDQLFVLTDGEAELLPTLCENCTLNSVAPECRKLWWGNEADIEALSRKQPLGFDVIIGADLVYSATQVIEAVPALFATVGRLLASGSDSRFVLALTRRNFGEGDVLAVAAREGLVYAVDEDTIYDIFDNNIDEQTVFWRDCVYVFSRGTPEQLRKQAAEAAAAAEEGEREEAREEAREEEEPRSERAAFDQPSSAGNY